MHGKYHHSSSKALFGYALALSAFTFLSTVKADFKDDIDFTKLKSEYSNLPTGQGIKLIQIEALRDGAWATPATGELANRVFSYSSSVGLGVVYSSHASDVGVYLGGSASSMTPNLDNWGVYESSYYTVRSLMSGRSADPLPSTWEVENHSWGGTDAMAPMTLQKMDFRIDRDNVIAVVGVDNGPTLSDVMANAYNVISVGTATGDHPHTGSTVDGLGRMKPDLVGTATYTSYATPEVSSSAVLLLGEIKRTPSLAAARSSMVMKAMLMAGASKTPFSSWSNSSTHPLDAIYGAGELNIYNSYKILMGGQQASSSNALNTTGWDSNTTSSSGRRYRFTVPNGKRMTLSAVLTWNRHITPGNLWFTTSTTLQNLDLAFWQADGNFNPVSQVAQSASQIDNVEHIYQKSLSAGNYDLDVVASVDGEKYGIAWKGDLVDDPSSQSSAPTPPPASAPVNPPQTIAAAPSAPAVVTNSIQDSGFENAVISSTGYYAYWYNASGSSWSFNGSAGLTGNNSGFTSSNPGAPSGNQVAFVQANGSISQSVNFSAGTYALSFQLANRANWGGSQTLLVYVDSQFVGSFQGGSTYANVSTSSFTVTDGSHTISFVGSSNGDCTALIDQVSLATSAPTYAVWVGNSGFEAPGVGSGNYNAFQYNPGTAAGSQDWSFQGYSGVSGNGSGFTSGNPGTTDGSQVGFLQSNNSSISQTLNLPASATYTISFQSAQRGNWNLAPQTVRVFLDGAQIGSVTPNGASYQTVSVTVSSGSGSHQLSFAGATGGDSTAFIDHVTIMGK